MASASQRLPMETREIGAMETRRRPVERREEGGNERGMSRERESPPQPTRCMEREGGCGEGGRGPS